MTRFGISIKIVHVVWFFVIGCIVIQLHANACTCPETNKNGEKMIVFHGTSVKKSDIDNIVQYSHGMLRQSPDAARLGSGIYFTPSLYVAKKIAWNRLKQREEHPPHHGHMQVVFKYEITLGKGIVHLDTCANPQKRSDNHDFSIAIHPAWTVSEPFTEVCIKPNPNSYKLIGVAANPRPWAGSWGIQYNDFMTPKDWIDMRKRELDPYTDHD